MENRTNTILMQYKAHSPLQPTDSLLKSLTQNERKIIDNMNEREGKRKKAYKTTLKKKKLPIECHVKLALIENTHNS